MAALDRRPVDFGDAMVLDRAAALLTDAAAVLLASGRWGQAHAHTAAAEIIRNIRMRGAPVAPTTTSENPTPDATAIAAGASSNP